MRAVEIEPGLVLDVARGRRGIELAVVEEAQILEARSESGPGDVPRIGQAVHPAEFFAVIGGDGQLLDPLLRQYELNDDFRVEVEIVRVQAERDPAQRVHRVDPITGVKLAESQPQEAVLSGG